MTTRNKVFQSGIYCLLMLILSAGLHAQPYSGGSNSGAFTINTSVNSCTPIRFLGSDNAGSVALQSALVNCTATRFLGEAGAGSSLAVTQLTDCVTNRFFGDSADGAANGITRLLDCTDSRFAGDTSSGADATVTNLLNCVNERFFGDTGSGFTAIKLLVVRQFLGADTSVLVVCNTDAYNLLSLYNAPGLTYNWNAANPTAATLGSYQLIATNAAGCPDTAMAELKQEITRWTGALNTNWHNAANWSNGKIPAEQTHVIIPGGTPNACEVRDADAVAASVQARVSGSFTIINNRVLRITGTCVSLPSGL